MSKPACPHCGCSMDPIETPYDSSWGGEIHHICFNDECFYFKKSWELLVSQGVENAGYRCRVDARGACGAIPITSKFDLKDLIITCEPVSKGTTDYFADGDFSRDDESPDPEFYAKPRFVDHLDTKALATVTELITKVIPKNAKILDLMSGPDSHISPDVQASEIIGLGLNEEELKANTALRKRVIHDINADPTLPFSDNEFDAVINVVSVDYITKPVEIFREAGRILKNKGTFLIVFSNRMFPPKAVRIWKSSTESERIDLVKKFFSAAEVFFIDGYFESKGHPRPADDKYYSLGIPSDPIYAIWGKVVK